MGNNFKFYSENEIDSAGALSLFAGSPPSVTSGYSRNTTTALIDRDRYNGFVWSAGAHTQTTIHATLASNVISAVFLQKHNFKNFTLHVNSVTVTPLNDNTNTSSWNAYTDTSTIVNFATVTAATVDIIVNSTTSGGDRSLGQFGVINEQYELPHNPAFADYKPVLSGQHIAKKMADKGYVIYKVADKFSADIKLNYVPASATAKLLTMYNTITAWNFCPFPTATAWDGDIWEMNWIGDYQFKQMARNQRKEPLFKGVLKLKETPV